MVTNQNCICKEIKSGLNLGNACYYTVQNLMYFNAYKILIGKPEGNAIWKT
jgi:hypothetical protein